MSATCVHCGEEREGDVWRPGEACLFGTLFACTIECATAWAQEHAPEGSKPGQPGFDVEIEADRDAIDLAITAALELAVQGGLAVRVPAITDPVVSVEPGEGLRATWHGTINTGAPYRALPGREGELRERLQAAADSAITALVVKGTLKG